MSKKTTTEHKIGESVLAMLALAEKRGAEAFTWNLGAQIEEADLVRKITEDTGSAEAHYAVRDVLGKVHDFINQLTQPNNE